MPRINDHFISRPSLTIGILSGIVVAVAWGYFVNHLIVTTKSSHQPSHWLDLARNDVYGLCYNGCGDSCLYPSIIGNACRRTAQTSLTHCDANKIWFWADRYPTECLEAVGELLKEDELWWTRFWLCGLYVFSIVFGACAGVVIGFSAEWLSTIWRRRRRITAARRAEGIRAPLLPPAVFAVALMLAVLANPAMAYPCPNYYPPYDRQFANMDGTIYGVVHGWLSECYDETYDCGESCSTSPVSGEISCTPISCTRSKPFMLPMDFVNKAAWRVEKCGFRFVDAIPGVVDRRIPNPRFEGSLWVKIAVNKFNSTDVAGEERLDEGVRCLYDMI